MIVSSVGTVIAVIYWVIITKYYSRLAVLFGAHDSVDKVEQVLTLDAADHLAKALDLMALIKKLNERCHNGLPESLTE